MPGGGVADDSPGQPHRRGARERQGDGPARPRAFRRISQSSAMAASSSARSRRASTASPAGRRRRARAWRRARARREPGAVRERQRQHEEERHARLQAVDAHQDEVRETAHTAAPKSATPRPATRGQERAQDEAVPSAQPASRTPERWIGSTTMPRESATTGTTIRSRAGKSVGRRRSVERHSAAGDQVLRDAEV